MTMPIKPIPKPPKAELILAALEDLYPAGSTVTLPQIADVGGVGEYVAGQVRKWARSVGRWPFRDGKGARPTFPGLGW